MKLLFIKISCSSRLEAWFNEYLIIFSSALINFKSRWRIFVFGTVEKCEWTRKNLSWEFSIERYFQLHPKNIQIMLGLSQKLPQCWTRLSFTIKILTFSHLWHDSGINISSAKRASCREHLTTSFHRKGSAVTTRNAPKCSTTTAASAGARPTNWPICKTNRSTQTLKSIRYRLHRWTTATTTRISRPIIPNRPSRQTIRRVPSWTRSKKCCCSK